MTAPFANLFLLGRPASGKSEFIDFIKNIPDSRRSAKYFIGPFAELDDFPWIWEKFMEDDLWEAAGYSRKFSSGGSNPGLIKEGAPLFDFCMAKLNVEYKKWYQQNGDFYKNGTLLIEFSRGGEEGYRRSFAKLAPELFDRSAILFVDVSYAESCRRNIARFEEKQKHTVLAHRVPDHTMEAFYATHDWAELTGGKSNGYLTIHDRQVPFMTMSNEPELKDPVALDKRYGGALQQLHSLYDR